MDNVFEEFEQGPREGGRAGYFWDLKSVEFLQIWGPALKSRYEFGAQKGQKKFHSPSTLSTVLNLKTDLAQ